MAFPLRGGNAFDFVYRQLPSFQRKENGVYPASGAARWQYAYRRIERRHWRRMTPVATV